MSLDEAIQEAVRRELRPVVDELRAAIAELKRRDDEYLSPRAAAKVAGVSPDTVRLWVKEKRLPEHRAGTKALRIRRSELEAFLDKLTHEKADPGDLEAEARAMLARRRQ